MILLILGVTIAMIVLGVVLLANTNEEGIGVALGVVGTLLFIVALIATIALGVSVSKLNTIDERIAMYEEENTTIEMQIAEVVKQYQKYETDIFTEVAPDSSITLVSMYPELKSDALVQTQIEVYLANNQTIRELREKQINGCVTRWWLYFGH